MSAIALYPQTTDPASLHRSLDRSRNEPAQWAVLRVEGGHEFAVQQHLAGRGLINFLPTFAAVRRFADGRRKTVPRPLFPGYLFVSGEAGYAETLLALSTPRVIDLLTFGRQRAYIDSLEMDRIRTMATLPGIEPWQRLEAGDRVRVTSGPLSGAIGKLLRYAQSHLAIVVEVELLGRAVKVEVDGWQVERA